MSSTLPLGSCMGHSTALILHNTPEWTVGYQKTLLCQEDWSEQNCSKGSYNWANLQNPSPAIMSLLPAQREEENPRCGSKWNFKTLASWTETPWDGWTKPHLCWVGSSMALRCLDHDLQTCALTSYYSTPRLVQTINMSNASVTERLKRGRWGCLLAEECEIC